MNKKFLYVGGRPPAGDTSYRQHLRDMLAERTAEHEREIAAYQREVVALRSQAQEDAQTISTLAALVAIAERFYNAVRDNVTAAEGKSLASANAIWLEFDRAKAAINANKI